MPSVDGLAGIRQRRLRALLGRPGVAVLAVLVAVLAGVFGAAGATRIGWEFAPALPSGAQAEELERTVLPGLAVTGETDAPLWGYTDDSEYLQFGSAAYTADPAGSISDLDTLALGARGRLVAAGWKPLDLDMDPRASTLAPNEQNPLRAIRDDLVVTYTGGSSFAVQRSAPAWLAWYAAAGALVGALLGLLLVGWASRRAEKGSLAAQLAGIVAWPTVVFMLSVLTLAALLRPAFQSWEDVYYTRLLWMGGGTPRWTGLVALIAIGIVVVLGRRPALQPRPAPTS